MDLKQLKALWKETGFRHRKSLGQNFLVDKNVRNNLLDALSLTDEDTVVEIGAGFGMMSFALADRCGKLFAVEKDRRIHKIMEPLFSERRDAELVCADILDLDLCGLIDEKHLIKVFGNVPYYISTPIMIRMIEQKQCIKDVHIVIQEELANRIVSPPGSKEYGSISCYIQFHAKPKKVFKIKRNSFYPSPQVDSCLLRLTMLAEPEISVKDKDLMFGIIRKAFSERRKKAVNPLSGEKFMSMDRIAWQEVFDSCGIDTSSRAENLSLSDYARIADEVGRRKQKCSPTD